MPLPARTRLGPYEIVAPLGAGGMGEVYRAKDTRLDREVAVKVLPAAFAQDRDRLARFEREAKAVAALSHPNILALFDTGTADGQVFLVTELLEGQTLRDRLADGPLPIRKATDVAVQVARGLAAAHDRGIVHRDLKPENIFLGQDGHVKILDFGLARPADMPSGLEATQTRAAITDAGTVLGTVGYMSPEQVRGQAVDARSDLFSFGAVLFEMLAGRRAFQRDTAAETMTAILREEPPDLTASRAEISPALDRIVRHCLEKDPIDRFQSARDVAFALGTLSGSATGAVAAVPAAGPTPPPRRRWAAPVLIAAGVVAAAAAGVLVGRALAPRGGSLTFEKKTWDAMWITNARFGPDGQTIVFSASAAGNVPELYAIRPGTITPQAIGQPATQLLSISSKGELAVLSGVRFSHHRIFYGTLSRMTLDGAPRSWMEDVTEADWSPDGSTVAVIHHVGAADQLEYPAGQVRYRFGGYLSDLRVSPDGKQVAFFEHQSQGDDRGFVKLLTAGGDIKLLAGEYWGEEGLAWMPDGKRVIFSASERGAEEQPLEVNVSGTPVVRQRIPSAGAMIVMDVGANGRMLIVRNDFRFSIRALLPGETAEREFPWLDFSIGGKLSSDRKMMAFSDLSQSAGANYAVALRNLATGAVVRLGDGLGWGLSPDGRYGGGIVEASQDLFLYPTGAGQPIKINRGSLVRYEDTPVWMPDGKHILFCAEEQGHQPRCFQQDTSGGVPQPITPEGIVEAALAPDGRTMLTWSTSGELQLRSIGSDATTPVKGLTLADYVEAWEPDLRSVIVSAGNAVPAHIERVDLQTGARTFIREVGPPDRNGLVLVRLTQWLDGGKGYVYDYERMADTIFVVTEGR